MQAVILAGGKGTRLRPFTTNIPKPLVPIDDLPILEVILRQLKFRGFSEIIITVNHLSELIKAFFGNGEKLGLTIRYSKEDAPMGTAGPLSLLQGLDENFLVMNGDILTTLDYRKLFDAHVAAGNDATIALYSKQLKIDLGVLKVDDDEFVDYIEKPTYTFDVSMGVYIFNSKVVSTIPENQHLDMPDFILKLKHANSRIRCFRDDYYWLDIGRSEDYETANRIFSERRKDFLPES